MVTALVCLGCGTTISGDLLHQAPPHPRGPTEAAPGSARALSVARTSGRGSALGPFQHSQHGSQYPPCGLKALRLPLSVWASAVCGGCSIPWSCLHTGCAREHSTATSPSPSRRIFPSLPPSGKLAGGPQSHSSSPGWGRMAQGSLCSWLVGRDWGAVSNPIL